MNNRVNSLIKSAWAVSAWLYGYLGAAAIKIWYLLKKKNVRYFHFSDLWAGFVF